MYVTSRPWSLSWLNSRSICFFYRAFCFNEFRSGGNPKTEGSRVSGYCEQPSTCERWNQCNSYERFHKLASSGERSCQLCLDSERGGVFLNQGVGDGGATKAIKRVYIQTKWLGNNYLSLSL